MPDEAAEHVRAVERLFAEWERGDFRGGADLVAPDVVFTTFTPESDDAVYEGPDGIREWLATFFEQWEDFGTAVERVEAAGDTVLIEGRQWGRGRQSGVRVEMPVYIVWRFRDGKATHLWWVRDRERALGLAVDRP